MFRKIFSALFCVCFLLAGCNYNEKAFIEKFLPKDDDALARQFLELVRTGDFAIADKMLEPSLRGEKSEEGFYQLRSVLAHGEQLSFEPIGLNINSFSQLGSDSNKVKRTRISYQIHFADDKWAAGDVIIQYKSNSSTILSARFNLFPDSLESLNRFTFSEKSIAHYLVFALVIALPVFIIYTLVVCARTPMLRRKWLWILFILFGYPMFQFDWTSGHFGVQLCSIWLLGGGVFSASTHSPWIFSFCVPLGAIVFWIVRHKLRAPETDKTETPPPAPPTLPATNDTPSSSDLNNSQSQEIEP